MIRNQKPTLVSPEALADALGRPRPTDQQSALIAAPLEPMLVVAGAGSGKTETIAQRVVYLVANGFAQPEKILGLTFTNKAAGELGQRIRTRLRAIAAAGVGDHEALTAVSTGQPTVSTYHSFAGQIIAEFGPLIGEEPAERVLSPTASWQLAREVVGRWDRDLDTDRGPEQVTSDILALSSALADHLVSVELLDAELAAIVGRLTSAPPSPRQRKPVHSSITSVIKQIADRRAIIPLVRAYHEAKRRAHAVDFSDQLYLAAQIVTTAPQCGVLLRDRYPIVLLDEYQDTGHSQSVILRGLFGEPTREASPEATAPVPWRGHAVMAVGDPVQSIYAWRGASASNLPRFARDFPTRHGAPAPVHRLLISFRNDRSILDVANKVSEVVRRAPVPVGTLEPATTATAGAITAALLPTVLDEDEWLADRIEALWSAGSARPSIAVLVRQRASMAPIAAALRDRHVPVEVVGVGGLVDEPEVADVIAMLRMVVDHQAGPSAVRILGGPRWRLGIADIAALARRARELSPDRAVTADHAGGSTDVLARIRSALVEAVAGEDVDEAGLVDAIADPGSPTAYSTEGWRRILLLGDELRRLRQVSRGPLRDLVASIERILGLDVETLLRPGGRVHLDALAEVVAELESHGAGPIEFLDYLATAAQREDGLAPGEVASTSDRVQILTVHAAKGLEWDVVALPRLSEKVFPSEQNSTWISDATQIPPTLRGDRADIPGLDLPDHADQAELGAFIADHRTAWAGEHLTEERRLFYVAVTRARHQLLLSAHHWTASRKTPAGPGEFFTDLVPDLVPASIDAPAPEDESTNPILDHPRTAPWPIDPLGDRRTVIESGAALVRQMRGEAKTAPAVLDRSVDEDPRRWWADASALLAERDAARRSGGAVTVPMPATVTVSGLVELADDAVRFARRLKRPVPAPPAPSARRGTAFHAWLERYFGGEPLLDMEQLPGAHDVDAAPDVDLPALIDRFRASPWASRTPIAVEVPFVTHIGGMPLRGRIDAVFAEEDGGAMVIDWKTGSPPGPERAAAVAIQLTAYRIAWSRLTKTTLDRVRAGFYYVAHDRLVTPSELMDADGLARLIDEATDVDAQPPS